MKILLAIDDIISGCLGWVVLAELLLLFALFDHAMWFLELVCTKAFKFSLEKKFEPQLIDFRFYSKQWNIKAAFALWRIRTLVEDKDDGPNRGNKAVVCYSHAAYTDPMLTCKLRNNDRYLHPSKTCFHWQGVSVYHACGWL